MSNCGAGGGVGWGGVGRGVPGSDVTDLHNLETMTSCSVALVSHLPDFEVRNVISEGPI